MSHAYDRVYGFFGDFRFLSNFYVEEDGLSGEHYFQAYKAADPEEAGWVMRSETPGKAKWRGRRVVLREGWEEEKDYYMALNLARKFRRGSVLAGRLLLTGDAELVEANRWGDTYWGVDQDTGEGENRLGKLLMALREELRAKEREQGSEE